MARYAPLAPNDPLGRHVIFRPQMERLQRPVARRHFGALALTDYGDHVEWTDGKRTTAMRLPDQPDSGAGHPVLDSVLIAEFRTTSYTPGKPSFYRIRFLDPSGAVICWLGPGSNTPVAAAQHMLPDPAAYQPLLERGVQLRHATYQGERQFTDDHPDPRITGPPGRWPGTRSWATAASRCSCASSSPWCLLRRVPSPEPGRRSEEGA